MGPLLAIATAALLSTTALAQTAPTAASDQDQAARHPERASAPAPSSPAFEGWPEGCFEEFQSSQCTVHGTNGRHDEVDAGPSTSPTSAR